MNRVFIVDDDPLMRSALRRLVAETGREVVEAEGGEPAVALLERERPGLVLTDLRMPYGDGFFVLRAVRRQWPQAPVIILTSSGDLNDCITALSEGATNFLSKPFHHTDLRAIVDHCFETGSGASNRLAGLITERHFALAEEEFPGITRFYAEMIHKPPTFLDLVRQFEARLS